MGPRETEEFQDCRDQQVLSAPGDLPGRKESAEWPGLLGRRDPPDLLDPRDLRDLWAPGGREERRDLLANLELLAWAAALVTRGRLALLDRSDLRALLDFRDHPGNLGRPGTQERGESEAPVVPQA